jgi:hypothetical protein
MLLDYSRYIDDIKERKRRRALVSNFRDPDQVPICFYFSGAFFANMFDIDID